MLNQHQLNALAYGDHLTYHGSRAEDHGPARFYRFETSGALALVTERGEFLRNVNPINVSLTGEQHPGIYRPLNHRRSMDQHVDAALDAYRARVGA